MPLGDVWAFRDWILRDNAEARPVEAWLVELGHRPYAHPSVPVPEMSQQPFYEVRYAAIGDPPVGIWYRQTYGSGIVDLFAVRRVSDTGWGDVEGG